MSQSPNKKSDQSSEKKSGEDTHSSSPQPQGPKKPWSEDLNEAANQFVEFLKDSHAKKALQDFLMESYQKYESEQVSRVKARVENERKVNSKGSAPFHQSGNLESLLHDELSMGETEQAFARGLKGTQAKLLRSVEERVEEINRLLSDIGGFSAQLKSCFARSTVVFLEQEDPKHSFRERLIFSINLPNYELKSPWESGSKKGKNSEGRTSLQVTWDEAVNALARIVETTGLKPKYCKNDRNYGRFVMKQDLRTTNIPDEYFSFTLDYNTKEKISEMCGPYNQIVADFETKLKKLAKKLNQFPEDTQTEKYLELKRQYLHLCQDRDFFVGTTPDPNQLDEGLLFLIEVSTLKDYHIVKDRMQSIMTRYILYLSKIAAKEIEHDPDLAYELSKGERKKAGKKASAIELTEDDLKDIPEYRVEGGHLKAVSPPPAPASLAKKKKKVA